MNYQNNLKKINAEINECLQQDKQQLIASFLKILENCKTYFKINNFDFWIKQINTIPYQEIPTTKEAIIKEQIKWQQSILQKNEFINRLSNTCEQILTFSDENDLCEMQSRFHYYFDIDNNQVFAESELGNLKLIDKLYISRYIQIATISNLKKILSIQEDYIK